jgi:hypothetical protein
LVHQWPEDLVVTAIAFPRPGETLLGDSDGNLTLYDSTFKVTSRWHAGDGPIRWVAASEGGILVFREDRSTYSGAIEFLTWEGKHTWRIPTADGLDFPPNPFVIVGHDALIIEPSESEKRWRFESRSLTTGKVNWTAPEGEYYLGWPVVCGNRVYIRDGDHIAGFSVSDGTRCNPQ